MSFDCLRARRGAQCCVLAVKFNKLSLRDYGDSGQSLKFYKTVTGQKVLERRDPLLLARAISGALARADAKYAIADCFDDMKSEYVGLKLGKLVEINLNSEMVLVRREVADAQLAKETPRRPEQPGGDGDGTKVQPPRVDARPRPRRFYAKIALDPNRPTPQVSNIAQSILSELDRVRGTKLTLTLDIDAEATEGFPEDVESVVRDNAASLRITDFGFEGD